MVNKSTTAACVIINSRLVILKSEKRRIHADCEWPNREKKIFKNNLISYSKPTVATYRCILHAFVIVAFFRLKYFVRILRRGCDSIILNVIVSIANDARSASKISIRPAAINELLLRELCQSTSFLEN